MTETQQQKKEKGTKNSTPDSVKNQVKYTKSYSKYKENSIILIDRITTQILRDQSYLVDDHQIRQYEYYIRLLNQIKRSVLIDPRYPHQIVQNKIDDLFSRDNQIKGTSVDILFNEIQNNLENFNPNVRAIF